MTKWRYTSVELASHMQNAPMGGYDFDRAELGKVLKEYGERGWELASTIEVGGHNKTTWNPKVILIFKQPEEEQPDSDSPHYSSETTRDLTSEQFEAWINSD